MIIETELLRKGDLSLDTDVYRNIGEPGLALRDDSGDCIFIMPDQAEKLAEALIHFVKTSTLPQ